MERESKAIITAGAVIGVIGAAMVLMGNPQNMGFCIACFIRDTAGGLGLHRAEPVQYVRPEIIGIILGSAALSVYKKEYSPRGGSSPMTRFILGAFVMVGCLMFLGCPFRMILRLAGGDVNALLGAAGFAGGILLGVLFLQRGYSLKRTWKLTAAEGAILPASALALLGILAVLPRMLFFTPVGGGPGAKHATVIVSLAAGLAVGAAAQRTRLCMAGGIRDAVLFRDFRLLNGFLAVLAAAAAANLLITVSGTAALFSFGFTGQPVAHTDGLWNALGMLLAGYASVLLGGCPLRQLVMAGEGNSDSAVTVLGYLAGAAFCHNFGLASSAEGPTQAGKTAVLIGLAAGTLIALLHTIKRTGEKA